MAGDAPPRERSPSAGSLVRRVARRIAVVPPGRKSAIQRATRRGDRRARPPAARGPAPRDRVPPDRAAIADAIDRVGVGRLIGRNARELSLGERQLVLLAVAVAQAAPIVVLDEPTVHLVDIRHQVEVMELLVDLNERDGRTILAVLHDLHLAASLHAQDRRARGRARRLRTGRPEPPSAPTSCAECSGWRPSRCPRGPLVRPGPQPMRAIPPFLG